ncbi:MAG: DUF58 domain-containing protein [Halobacteriaceae archaeon]
MSYRRTLFTALGIVAFVAGAVSLFVPGVTIFQQSMVLVIIGALLGIQSIRYAYGRYEVPATYADVPEVERRLEAVTPGVDFDERLQTALSTFQGVSRIRGRILERVRSVGRDLIARTEQISEEAASQRLQDGSWTDDAWAAAFLAGGSGMAESYRPLRSRVLESGSSGSPFGIDTAHAVGVLGSLVGIGNPDGDPRIDTAGPADAAAELEESLVADRPSTADFEVETRETDRWVGVGAVALSAVGLGVVTTTPPLVLAGVVGAGFGIYARTGEPTEISLSVEREIVDPAPQPGDEVTIRVTVHNEGDGMLPDVRIIDGVPTGLAVVDGSPRRAAALRPEKGAAFEYAVEAARGVHEFDPVLVLARDFAGTVEQATTVEAPDRLTCRPSYPALDEVPLPVTATGFAGRLALDESGAGVEFYGVRDYRRGDPMNRIDWRRYAKTGDLATIEFRAERDASVMLLVDTRASAYRSPAGDTDTSVDRAVEAAGHLAATMGAVGYQVGLAALGPERCWIDPGYGDQHVARIQERLAVDPAFSPEPPDGDFSPVRTQRRLRDQFDPDAQLVFLSPLVDGLSKLVALRLKAYGYPVTVVSPDPTDADTVGHRLVRLERHVRVSDLRRGGVHVLDWGWDEDLVAAFARSRRWSR